MAATTSPGVTAHPRSRGENPPTRTLNPSFPGSSPLTRGKRDAVPPRLVGVGLIPAHAGKTQGGTIRSLSAAAHPRSRGENGAWATSPFRPQGSSPLTRGKQKRSRTRRRARRLIPAHAGKTEKRGLPDSDMPAHPRSRGENGYTPGRDIYHFGSSPLTRGKPQALLSAALQRRLIPAHAGKTSVTRRPSYPLPAHPRSRGENRVVYEYTSNRQGSSPLTRGKHAPVWSAHTGHGLIPAHAGKTRATRWAMSSPAAHPRSRGENVFEKGIGYRIIGSSPLTRGKRVGDVGNGVHCRLIPAHAGKT